MPGRTLSDTCAVSSAQASGPCNLEMPNGPSVYQRYLWYLRLLTYNGFVVLADNHLNSDGTIVNAGVDTWVSVRPDAPSHPLAWADAGG